MGNPFNAMVAIYIFRQGGHYSPMGVPWHNLVVLWGGAENCAKLYTEKVRRGLRNGDFRQKYDFAFGILRGEPVQAPRWGSEYCEKLRHTFVSDRWNH